MRNLFKHPFFLLVLLSLAVIGGYRYYLSLTDGFEASNVTISLPHRYDWDIPKLPDEEYQKLVSILNQKYTYIGKGAQSYAFGSADGQYVLKFFKYKHLLPNPLIKYIPSWPKPIAKWKHNYFEHKKYRFQTLFDGHHLAYTQDKDHSALVYIHLNTNEGNELNTILIDKWGREHHLGLNKTAFVLQKKGTTARNMINAQLKNGDVNAAWDTLRDIIVMLISEYNLGIYDRDHGVLHNTGFAEGKPFHLDVGKLTSEPSMKEVDVQAQDLFKVVHRIFPWIHNHYPEHEQILKQRMQDMLSVYLEREFVIDK